MGETAPLRYAVSPPVTRGVRDNDDTGEWRWPTASSSSPIRGLRGIRGQTALVQNLMNHG